jgi:hypothetical protein
MVVSSMSPGDPFNSHMLGSVPMDPLIVNKTDGKRLIIDLDRVILFEEINSTSSKVLLEGGGELLLSVSLEGLMKAIEQDEEAGKRE